MENTLLAYMAGIIDGEGCLTISKQLRKNRVSPAYRVSITVCNTDRKLVDLFAKHFEGIVYERVDKRIEKKWANAYTWYCPCRSVISFLNSILPFLISKKEQAEILIEFQKTKSSYKRKTLGQGLGSKPLSDEEIKYKDSIHSRVRQLNSKGVFSRKNLNHE